MKNIMIGSNRYISGAKAIDSIGSYSRELGTKAFIIGGRTALSKTLNKIVASLEAQSVRYTVSAFTTEVCHEQVDSFAQEFTESDSDFVIGVGGGKALDCSKWVADKCSKPCITVPTCAATCAGMVSLIITYTRDGIAAGGIYAKSSPYLCLADTEVITEAPRRLIISGIADTLSKWAETHFSMKEAPENIFNFLTSSLSRKVFDSLVVSLKKISNSLDNDIDFQELVDNILFMSALIGNTAGDSYRLAIAHSIHDGLIAIDREKMHEFMHGEKVAYGTLVQLALIDDFPDKELVDLVYAFSKCNLPISLCDFGLVKTDEMITELIRFSLTEKIMNGPAAVSSERFREAILKIEDLSLSIKKEGKI